MVSKYLIFTAIVVWGICAEEIARAGDPLRDVVTNTMLDMGQAHPKVIAPAPAATVSHVQVCNADLSKCGPAIALGNAPAKVKKPAIKK